MPIPSRATGANPDDGKYIIRGLTDILNTKICGWFDYKWPNPVTKAVEAKSSHMEKVDNLIVCSGIYKP